MRLKNEAEFLDDAFGTHLLGLDELVVVYNRCTDATPEICQRWAERHPGKIRVFEYEPEVVPLAAPEARTMDPRDEHSLANYYNWALTRTTRQIAIKVDGDHIGDAVRFARTCDRVRRRLARDETWPIYGINITRTSTGEVGIYNLYGFDPQFGVAGARRGPPSFTSGDHAFYHVTPDLRHTTDPLEGYERLDLGRRRRAAVGFTYLFFHMKGMKTDHGMGNWNPSGPGVDGSRGAWIEKVRGLRDADVASFAEMRLHNPQYFRESDARREFQRLFPRERLLPDPPLPWSANRLVEAAKGAACRVGVLRGLGFEK